MAEDLGSLIVRVGLDGSDFDRGITNLNSRMKLAQSELKASQSSFNNFGNSIDGLRSKQEGLTRIYDLQGERVKQLRQRYDEMVRTQGENSDAALRAGRTLNSSIAYYNRLGQEVESVQGEIRDLSTQLDRQNSVWGRSESALNTFSDRARQVGQSMKDVGQNLTMKVTTPLLAMGGAAFKAAVDFESAFAGVKKTVNTSEEGFKKLENGIRDMAKELPASASDIAAVAESAGQLGIAEDKILSFSRTVIDLGESTNLTREQAATEFARFANIVGMSQDNFDRLGSSIVGLGKGCCPVIEKSVA